jgi:hypothetical protein
MLLCNDDTGRIFFQLLRLVFCEKEIPKIAGHSQNRSNMTFLKGGIDGLRYFSLVFSYFPSRIIPVMVQFYIQY